MRVTKYDMLLNEEQHPYLVKEESRNCPDVEKMISPQKIKKVMDDVFNASYLAEEHVWIVAMNVKCRPLGVFEISHGNVSISLVGTREILCALCCAEHHSLLWSITIPRVIYHRQSAI